MGKLKFVVTDGDPSHIDRKEVAALNEGVHLSLVGELEDMKKYMDENSWAQSMDASLWAAKFLETMKTQKWKKKDIDESLMLSWFACAIMAGYDEASRRYRRDFGE